MSETEMVGTRWIEYPFPLRDGNCSLIVPRDLSLTEARRLAAYLETLTTSPEAGGEPSPLGDLPKEFRVPEAPANLNNTEGAAWGSGYESGFLSGWLARGRT